MKEILFRAKRIDNGEWVCGFLVPMWGQMHIIDRDFENTAYPIDDSTICQYTGLTDKNGKRIWENDIVSCEHEKYPEDNPQEVYPLLPEPYQPEREGEKNPNETQAN